MTKDLVLSYGRMNLSRLLELGMGKKRSIVPYSIVLSQNPKLAIEHSVVVL
jgi:hypothetical protein